MFYSKNFEKIEVLILKSWI